MTAATLARPQRRWWAPEVVQTSSMDCGPAALKCLLEGHHIPVGYGRLREACQTDVDGTSIDTLEVGARLRRCQAPPGRVNKPRPSSPTRRCPRCPPNWPLP